MNRDQNRRYALTLVSGWSCDEEDRAECRNRHGCHCREITALLAQKSAPPDISSLPSGGSDPSVTTDCGGADAVRRAALASVIHREQNSFGMRKALKVADAIIAAECQGIGTP